MDVTTYMLDEICLCVYESLSLNNYIVRSVITLLIVVCFRSNKLISCWIWIPEDQKASALLR